MNILNDYLIVSDGTVDLNKDTVEKLGIKIIPMIYILDGAEHFYDPSAEDFDFEDFYKQVNAGVPVSTSQNPPALFKEYFEKFLKISGKILYICFSSGLSGNYNSAVMASREVMEENPGTDIRVVDSLCASVGEGLLVKEICRKSD